MAEGANLNPHYSSHDQPIGVSNHMKTLHIKGRVVSGKGEGAKFIKLPWVKKQIVEKLGFLPYPGTLNMKLIGDNKKLREFLKKSKPIEIVPTRGYYCGKCFAAYFMGDVHCFIVIPEIAGYPEDVLEVVASINFREKFHLKDGDTVTFAIMS